MEDNNKKVIDLNEDGTVTESSLVESEGTYDESSSTSDLKTMAIVGIGVAAAGVIGFAISKKEDIRAAIQQKKINKLMKKAEKMGLEIYNPNEPEEYFMPEPEIEETTVEVVEEEPKKEEKKK